MMTQVSKQKLLSARLIPLTTNLDERGALTVIETDLDIPFTINRCYVLHHLNGPRGGHAHQKTHQLVVAASGSCQISLSDGIRNEMFVLDTPTQGLLLSPMTWIEMPIFSLDAVIVVLASTHYDSTQVIRDWDIFLHHQQQESIS